MKRTGTEGRREEGRKGGRKERMNKRTKEGGSKEEE